MSSTAYLLLLFLCISLHACNARRIGPLDKKMEKKHHFSTKSDEKIEFDSSPKQLNDEGNGNVGARLVADSMKPKSRRSTHQIVLKGKASGSLRTESLASVSWRVPHHKKHSQKQLVQFDVDYEPPKTHPPSHN
ncbi:uncharacterized protein LOC130748965 [Lotus japonicus]|uniref:uncharacterized protein LOC130748965 n=1 Tax=Lotus japonicus TaxID=34305 RepID=UPI00258C0989|nr:uncharacterized protein LOC130748965 [Lotus japonicus]